MPILGLAKTTPTLLPEQLRSLAVEAERLSVDRANAFDNNPFIAREWLIVAGELRAVAGRLEMRFGLLFGDR